MQCIEERNQKFADSQDIMIEVDPEIAKVFKNSNFVSCKSFEFIFILRYIFMHCFIYI